MNSVPGAVVHAGGWEIDLLTNALTWSPEVFRMHEVGDDFVPTVERAIAFYDESSRQAITEAVEQAVSAGRPFDLTLNIVTAKGRPRIVRAVGNRKRGPDGQPVAVFGTFQDLTEVVELQQQLQETRGRYAALFENMATGFVLYSPIRDGSGAITDFRIEEFNPAIRTLVGNSLSGHTLRESDPLDGELRVGSLREVLETGQARDLEWSSQTFGFWVSAHSFLAAPSLVASLFTNITERKVVEERLKESERQLKIIFDSTGTSNSIFDLDCRLVRQNNVSVAQLGLPEDVARGKDVIELFGEARGLEVERRMRAVIEHRAPAVYDTEFSLPSGTKTFRSSYQPLFDSDQVVGVQIVSQDITEQVLAQKTLRENELQFRTFFELAADLVCVSGLDSVFRRINPAGQALLKYDEQTLLSRPFTEFIHPDDRERTNQVIADKLARGETVIQFENRYLCGDGSVVSLEWVSRPDLERGLVYAVARDVTARRRFEAEQAATAAQIRKTQKLESLGILAGGIAHDFNNILAGILSFVELAAQRNTDEKSAHYWERIQSGCLRAQALTRQLLTFAKGGIPVLKVVEPGPVVESAVQFASHGSQARITVRVEPHLPLVSCDPEQIGQVVSNLVINALQAMDGGGKLEVTVASEPSGMVCRVTDSGPGIAPEVLDKIFDPFFTTKKSGTGLGLSICHSIVHNHHGTLTVESTVGVGTTFSLRLPAAPAPQPVSHEGSLSARHRGQGRALVLDDEEAIREAVAEILGGFGYEASAVADTAEFQRVWTLGETPSLCLLDLTIPGDIGGAAWAQQLRDRGYRGRLVAMSGYSADSVLARPLAHGFDAAIAKPFRIEALAELLEGLGSPATETP